MSVEEDGANGCESIPDCHDNDLSNIKPITSSPLTPAQRKANERKRKRAYDLIPLEIWVHKTQKNKAKLLEKELRKPLSD